MKFTVSIVLIWPELLQELGYGCRGGLLPDSTSLVHVVDLAQVIATVKVLDSRIICCCSSRMKTSAVALFALTRSPFYNFLQHFSGRCLQKHVFGNISVGVNFEEAGSCQQSRSALYFPSTFREVLFSGRSHVIIVRCRNSSVMLVAPI